MSKREQIENKEKKPRRNTGKRKWLVVGPKGTDSEN
jgi:hypothetical protein